MKPAPFKYFKPEHAEEAYSLLDEHGAEARILAGGQSLVPLMNMRVLRPGVLIDINRCRHLAYLRYEDGAVACGALTRQSDVEYSALVADRLPLLSAAIPYVGVRASRNFGTVCGSLAHADPVAELPSVAIALEARFVIASKCGTREVGADEFFVAALTNCLQPNEMLTEVKIPAMPPGARSVFLEISNRAHGFAVVGLASCIELDKLGRARRVRLSAMGAGDITARIRPVELLLEGQVLGDEIIGDAVATAMKVVDPFDDVHASATYRRQAVGTLVKRALRCILQQSR